MRTPTLLNKLLPAFMLFLTFSASGQQSAKDQSIFLLSNLESLSSTAPELDAIQEHTKGIKGEFTIIINGDFVDKNGLGTNPEQEDLDKLDRLMGLAGDDGRLVFIPGDREWDNGGKRGLKKVKALEKYLESKMGKGKVLFPQKGCLGPEIIDIGDNLRIVAINTQWFVEEGIGPQEEEVDCGLLNATEFWGEFSDVLSDSDNRNLVVAGHHPALSFGQYAGYKLLKQHFSPPVIGSIIASYHQNIGGPKDLNNKELKQYSREVLKFAQMHPGAIFVSGHEYDTQVLYKDGSYHINSGAAVKAKPVGRGKETIYRQKTPGFAQLIFEEDGTVRMKSYAISDQKNIQATFEHTLFVSPCADPQAKTPTNILHNPCIDQLSENPSFTGKNTSGTTVAGQEYSAGFLRKALLGKHYRSTWVTPIHNIPYLDLETTYGGLKPYAKGGGAQTSSIKFKSADGRRFSFRSINKNPTKRMDKDLRPGIYGKVTQDKTSHQHPYSSTILAPLMDRLDIPHSMPKLYIMPDSPKLGPFREEFGGMFGTLELKPKGKKKSPPGFRGADKVVATQQMYRKLLDDNDNKIDVQKFVQTRLFDIWISDWDRHVNNYKWLKYKDGKTTTYTIFPKDRDKALSLYQGFYWFIEVFHLQADKSNFRKNFYGLKYLNFKNKTMDRWLANSYTHADWMAEVKNFQTAMSDEAIADAISKLPPEVQPLVRKKMTKRLKARRDRLPKAITRYYKMLAKYIDLVGTNSKEFFELNRLKNGDVQATIYKLKKNGEKGKMVYKRLIKRKETKEIRLHGLGKKDKFVINGEAKKSILIRVIGGKGKDTIEDHSKVRGGKKMTLVYDKRGKDKLSLNTEAKKVNTLEVLSFKSQEFFNYNYLKVLPNFAFNQDDGLILGLNGSYSKQKFNKPDFGQKYNFSGSLTTNNNYNLNVSAQYRHVIHKWDAVLGIALASNDKSFRRFYGLSNENILDDDLNDLGFYTNNSKSFNAHIGLTRTFMTKSSFTFAVKYDLRDVDIDEAEGKPTAYDDIPDHNGLDETVLVGPHFNLNIDLRDHGAFPTKGMQFRAQNFTFVNTDESFGTGGRLESELSTYFTVGVKFPVTLSVKGGLVSSYGDVPFYYKAYLGQQGNHRGFLKNRFGGDTATFINSDLRLHFGKLITPLVPIKYGIFGLYDLGRTWREGESSDKLHYAFGGGVYIIPYVDSFNLTFTVAQSDENDLLFSFRVGFFVR